MLSWSPSWCRDTESAALSALQEGAQRGLAEHSVPAQGSADATGPAARTRRSPPRPLLLRISRLCPDTVSGGACKWSIDCWKASMMTPSSLFSLPFFSLPAFSLPFSSPSLLSPSLLSPFLLSPFLLSISLLSPFLHSPFILSPSLLSPSLLSPFLLSPFLLSPSLRSRRCGSPARWRDYIITIDNNNNKIIIIIIIPDLFPDLKYAHQLSWTIACCAGYASRGPAEVPSRSLLGCRALSARLCLSRPRFSPAPSARRCSAAREVRGRPRCCHTHTQACHLRREAGPLLPYTHADLPPQQGGRPHCCPSAAQPSKRGLAAMAPAPCLIAGDKPCLICPLSNRRPEPRGKHGAVAN